MIRVPDIEGQPVAVMGLGVSGLATVKALRASGAQVWAWDDAEDKRKELGALGLAPVDLLDCDWTKTRTLVLSPGIPHSFPEPHPVAQAARDAGVEIVCDVELLGRAERRARFIGITGTNGKSTTTALVAHILEAAGRDIEMGGNFGPPVLAFRSLDAEGVYVLEMSSFQLERTSSIVFDVAVLLNITPDHIDRHGDLAGYIEAKQRIFEGQGEANIAVVGIDDDHGRALYDALADTGAQRIIPISSRSEVQGGVYVRDGVLYDDMTGRHEAAGDLGDAAALPGAHNWQNAAAAYAATVAFGVEPEIAVEAVRRFPGLPHRQEVVAVIDGVAYVNDSKATNADATSKALGCYERIYWIAGGQAKAEGIASLAPFFPRIVHAFLIGEAADDFARTLDGAAAITKSGDLEAAVAAAHDMAARDTASPRPVVLLSPACASYDQFPNFAARGEAFRALVEALPGAARPQPVAAAGGCA
jgi:UDP-N-acetylmuramoylalanine--D-glutamate ligase